MITEIATIIYDTILLLVLLLLLLLLPNNYIYIYTYIIILLYIYFVKNTIKHNCEKSSPIPQSIKCMIISYDIYNKIITIAYYYYVFFKKNQYINPLHSPAAKPRPRFSGWWHTLDLHLSDS